MYVNENTTLVTITLQEESKTISSYNLLHLKFIDLIAE